jgi:signal recognition particle GTPase
LSETPWLDRLRGGFRKTSDRLGDNLTGLFTKAALDAQMLEEIEEALIASDLGPAAAARVRNRLAGERFERGLSEAEVKRIVADELAKSRRHVPGRRHRPAQDLGGADRGSDHHWTRGRRSIGDRL